MTRPVSFARRVEQAMLDLLAVSGDKRRDVIPVEGDPLPIGVAARLGLLVAAATDAAVLTGGLGRGSPEDQTARRKELGRAAGLGMSVDVGAPVVLPVRCGKRTHALRLSPGDELEACSHPGIDLTTERVAAALGGAMLPCVREMIGASSSWQPPVADDGPRQEPIGAGELLAFVSTCRSWLARGFALRESAPAVELGLSLHQIAEHLELGLRLPAAAEWAFVPAAEAVRWVDIGFRPSDAQLWLSQRRTLEQAEAAAGSAGVGRWLARWARVAGGSVDAELLAGWASVGLPVGVWGEVASRGVRAEQAGDWLFAGFTSVEVLRYAHLRVGLVEAQTWRDEGFTAYVAAGCLGVGMTLADACSLRGLPMRDVQDAWTRSSSIDEVRAEVEAKVAEIQAAEFSLR